MASALFGEEDFGGHSILIYLGAALREMLLNPRGFWRMAGADGGLYLVAAKTALEVGEFGTNQVNMLIYKQRQITLRIKVFAVKAYL